MSLVVEPCTTKSFGDLADHFLREGTVLRDHSEWHGAYYLLGYAIECALKAVLCSRFHEGELPDKHTVNRAYTHDFKELLKLSGLDKSRSDADEDIKNNWSIVEQWSESTRYGTMIEEDDVESLFVAISDTTKGVLPWIRRHS